ncbi:MAG: hypothetical protein Q8R07_05680 [Candidatus Uhrbacteria bacterium]|nr:hypothetical protein [Candidatus Uhrbacteria bacterium]
MRLKSWILVGLLALCPSVAWPASVGTVTVDSSTVGVLIVANVGGGCTVTVPIGEDVPVYVARLNGTCSTDLTAPRGVRIALGGSYDFKPATDGWSGQLCAILESGSNAVIVSTNCW